MLLNKRVTYLGISLFSALLLMPSQNVFADSSTTQTTSSEKISTVNDTKPKPATSQTTLVTTSTPVEQPTESKSTSLPPQNTETTTSVSNPSVTSAQEISVPSKFSQTATSTSSPNTSAPSAQKISATINPPQVTAPTNDLKSLPDNTVVSITDPLLASAIKQQFQLKPTDSLTVGTIKKYTGTTFNSSIIAYEVGQKQTSMNDDQTPPIESLNGMQYLQLLPNKPAIFFQAKLASDANADEDLTPLNNLNFAQIDLIGNYSNSKDKEIDVNQLTKLNVQNATNIALNGDKTVSYDSGLDNQQLVQVSPWLNSFAHNGAKQNIIELSNSDLTDLTPLKGLEDSTKTILMADTPLHYDPTPIYAVKNQPISFTAPKVLGLDGDNLATGYHFSNTVSQENLAEEDLENHGNGQYTLTTPYPNASALSYGYLGWGYSSNPNNFVNKNYGNTNLQFYIFNAQPLRWQNNPTVTISYFENDGQPIKVNGQPLVKVINGVNIGDPFDLTSESTVPGYQLINSDIDFKGNFSQNPLFLNLVYNKKISSSSNNNNQILTIPEYDNSGNMLNNQIPIDKSIIIASNRINGKTFYQLNNQKWVLSNDFYENRNASDKIIRSFDQETTLINHEGNIISTSIAPNSEWQYFKIVKINGKSYYEIAPNEFLSTSSAIEFHLLENIAIHLKKESPVYNASGQKLKHTLTINSNWHSDGFAIINHQKMYRIADDEWVPVSFSYSYRPTDITFYNAIERKLYNSDGQMLNKLLPSGSSWKVDQIITIAGQSYYRVATNEFVQG